MKKFLIFVILAIIFGTALYYDSYNIETLELTSEELAKAPGDFIDLSFGKVHYEMANGDGLDKNIPIVLIHGFSVPYYIWEPTFKALADSGFTVIRYDLYGRGWSARPDVDYTPELFSTQLTELLDKLGISGQIDVAGLSMGGGISTHFTAHNLDKVRKLIFVDPAYPMGGTGSSPMHSPVIGEFFMRTKIAPGMAAGQLGDFYEPEKFPEWSEKYKIQMQYKGFQRAILSTIRNSLGADLSAEYKSLGKTDKQIMLIYGSDDKTIPKSTFEQIKKDIPHIVSFEIEKAGHIPHYERPALVNNLIIDFLKK